MSSTVVRHIDSRGLERSHWNAGGSKSEGITCLAGRGTNIRTCTSASNSAASLVGGDGTSATWSTEIRVRDRAGDLDFAGAAVQGRPGERFAYLTWGNIEDDGSFAMFRRATLMLADVASLLSSSETDRRVVATVDLTDDCGGPRCARLRPPALTLTMS
jgi:hypothetical protein